MRQCFLHGADKVAINTGAFKTPQLIRDGAHAFGAQAIVVCIDVKRHADGRYEVVVDGGREATGVDPVTWAKQAIAHGAGELLVQSIDRDGTAAGYDLELIGSVAAVSSVPVIALGGVGRYENYVEGVKAGADAVAAANIFHFKELSDRNAKRTMAKGGLQVRI
jgi:cyclase